ncbi:MAG: nucleoid occlusion factor SlmA [Proteobacteria bacterium]|nr:MAG: nucleoid occlusion factor SlmA [Pseudomonadota bacterium]QKK11146.1 MAG: nucleoid occlusion factor SlmA [Pseudomonadota bacterium]
MTTRHRGDRRREILEALAHQLETSPGERMTTAGLAASLDISEAALYRHFASKAQMYEGLLEFAEESVFERVNRILEEERGTLGRIDKMVTLVLLFAERNPGITRLLIGDALVGETARLRDRVEQFFDRLETHFRQVLREGEISQSQEGRVAVPAVAELLVNLLAGKMQHYVRSGFKRKPSDNWEVQWRRICAALINTG